MKILRFAMKFHYSMVALILMSICWGQPAMAQAGHSHTDEITASQKSQATTLVDIVRQSTARFRDVSVAEAEGYLLQFGCVTGPDVGAMGLHYVNGDLVARGELDPTRPQIVIYEPKADGHLQLTGADFLVIASAWDANRSGPPELMGQLFHFFESPNRFGLPAFYTLHVWAWKENPNGAFVNWHPNVSCQSFTE